jgi:hypothetical protein
MVSSVATAIDFSDCRGMRIAGERKTLALEGFIRKAWSSIRNP